MSNFTIKMEHELASLPMDYYRAESLAEQWGLSVKSVVAKTKSLGLDYLPKPIIRNNPNFISKLDLIRKIERKLNCELPGLEKASAYSLNTLLKALN